MSLHLHLTECLNPKVALVLKWHLGLLSLSAGHLKVG